jgi:hypothetical protein
MSKISLPTSRRGIGIIVNVPAMGLSKNLFRALVVFVGMARMAEGNQVYIGIVPSLTSHLSVMHV